MTDRAPAAELPAATRIAAVHLRVSDLDRSLAFYGELLGLRLLDRTDGEAQLSASGQSPALLRLTEHRGAVRRPRRATGLFHVAWRAPDRAGLGRWLRRLLERQTPLQGASDHAVSEALYLADPDGLGVELYCDRPRESWPMRGPRVAMTSEPFDTQGVAAAAAGQSWEGADAATDVGHVHLCVSSLDRAEQFYVDSLGFAATQRDVPGALFLAAGGYHHHLGTNTWSSGGAGPAPDDAVGLLSYTVEVPSAEDVADVRSRLETAGWDVHDESGEIITADGDGIGLRLRAA